ncbi:ABC transporter ATP-binding protein [Ancylobacter sp. WKF20]|uniref:ABC transporter ATP-binding protein n=1 Tax=Ancylobacter sp. WKF20 TaxID=3039801 RepID=UPI0024343AAF|nr:ABC transporter ATP-binding protein [Ancylobacter sp. WKF20]WGD28979.1 ABC transporter ATP-binding protein [Ancylobacter sp. WKF20]
MSAAEILRVPAPATPAEASPAEASPAVEPSLRIKDVRLEYSTRGKTVVAIDNISIDVPDNQFAVIVGPSGCGKSSLLYLVAGLAQPTSGEILLGEEEVDGPGPDRGMVFQSYTLFPWLTVRENVEFGLKRRKVPAAEREEIVNRYLNETGLAAFHDAYPKQLSGGMMQRVAIARALANDPKILLMDEPFGALDSQTRNTMQKLLLRVWEENRKTVLFVTHDIDEAILLGDRIYVMTARPGRLKEEIIVPIARPRSMDMVMDPAFIAVKRQILELLKNEIKDDEH